MKFSAENMQYSKRIEIIRSHNYVDAYKKFMR